MNGSNPIDPESLNQPLPSPLQKLLNTTTASGEWKPNPNPQPIRSTSPTDYSGNDSSLLTRCIAYLARMPEAIQGNNGSSACMEAARAVCWGFGYGEDRGFEILWDHYNPRCVPQWSELELRHKCMDAMRGSTEDFGHIRDSHKPTTPRRSSPPGRPSHTHTEKPLVGQERSISTDSDSPPSSDPPTDPPLPEITVGVEDNNPHRLARLYLRRYDHSEGSKLRHWNGEFCLWESGSYDRISEAEIRKEVTRFLDIEFTRIHVAKVKVHELNEIKRESGGCGDKPKKPKSPKMERVTRGLVSDVIQALQGECSIDSKLPPPCWLDEGPNPLDLVSATNGILNIRSLVNGNDDSFLRPTPRFFTFNRTDYPFDHHHPVPKNWLKFLNELWPGDESSIDCLQEWLGYLLVPDTSQQKILMMIGPPRSGKGTILKVIESLIGESNTTAPDLNCLGGNFGLQSLIGKTVALIGDARLSSKSDLEFITGRLLGISGGDVQTIDRKNKEMLKMRLNTRFVVCSNELPSLSDSSGAIVGRLIILRMIKSFLGREDVGLFEQKLKPELPGILAWAIVGWDRLQQNRKFTIPASGGPLREQAEELVSPIKRFILDWCERGPDFTVKCEDLFDCWCAWCEENKEKNGGVLRFGKMLFAACPEIVRKQIREGEIRPWNYSGIGLPYESRNELDNWRKREEAKKNRGDGEKKMF